jgi:hypothetical protein
LSRIDENSFDESSERFGIGSKNDYPDSDADKKSESIRKYSGDLSGQKESNTQRNTPTINFKSASVKNGK